MSVKGLVCRLQRTQRVSGGLGQTQGNPQKQQYSQEAKLEPALVLMLRKGCHGYFLFDFPSSQINLSWVGLSYQQGSRSH